MLELHRLTSEYIETEDRLRLTGEDQQGDALCVWLTQRLAIRIIVHLTELIAKASPEALQNPTGDSGTTDLLQGHAQEAATSELTPQPAVDSSKASRSILINEVDISRSPEGAVGFIFKDGENEVSLGFDAQQIRQWLTIIHGQWLRAEWPSGVWPQWISRGEVAEVGAVDKPVH